MLNTIQLNEETLLETEHRKHKIENTHGPLFRRNVG